MDGAGGGSPEAAQLRLTAEDLQRHQPLSGARAAPIGIWRRIDWMPHWLGDARRACLTAPPDLGKAAEWLLDNDYLVHRAIRQADRDLPSHFYARLPATPGLDRPLPRAFAAAHGLLHATRMQLSLSSAVDFVRAYQGDTPFSIAELWAFPTMLRLACLEILAVSFGRLFPSVEPPFHPSPYATTANWFDDTERVARSIANLGLIASIPWEDFFDRTSRVEELLAGDPAGVYSKMDFTTRDRYRRTIEALAERCGVSEPQIASLAVAKAAGAGGSGVEGHVGHWLIGDGRRAFEAETGYVPRWGTRLRRWAADRARSLYGLALFLVTAGALVIPAFYMAQHGARPFEWIVYLIVAPIPSSILAVTVVHWAVTQLVSPRVLPKIDFDEKIAPECRTLVVVPVLVGSPPEAAAILERLEAHRLANPDPSLAFAILSDLRDAPAETQPGDAAIEEALSSGIVALNARYGNGTRGPFHLLHRHRLFNAHEGCWMGWERKRGKLEQLNRLLLGKEEGGFALHVGDKEALRDVRFVVTADADTRLPVGSVNRLVGALAHPLNKARFDPVTGRITAGYSIIQPRVEVSPESGSRSIFARFYTGDTAIDIYSRAVSDVYQDLFGEGIFVGKGIYDVAAFHRSIDGRVPDNAILSHDLFEGLLGRAALATDIVLYEGFPQTYLEFVRRSHRWVRGDWQLLPWLFRKVPAPGGARLPNPFSGLDRWKIVDNLRRSLITTSLLALALAGWLLLPGSPWVWTALAGLAPAAHLFTDLISGLARGPRRGSVRGTFAQLGDQAGRWYLAITFLPKEAGTALNAIGTVLWRMLVSHRHLLEWTSAAHVAQSLGRERSRAAIWAMMWEGPVFALVALAAILVFRDRVLLAAVPLLLLWVGSPEVAIWIGRPLRPEEHPLDAEDRAFLRRLARRTWLYFESFAGPEDHWLPPDNFQEEPYEEIAHRTSPTNIGMMLVSGLTVWDLGFLGTPELSARLANTFEALDAMERHRGHFLNWYDTRTLTPLEPRYVSTVDSGNLAVSLVTVGRGCNEAASTALLPARRWEGLLDVLAIVEEAAGRLSAAGAREFAAAVEAARTPILKAESAPALWRAMLDQLSQRLCPALESKVVAALAAPGTLSATVISELSVWVQRLRSQIGAIQRDLEELAPWVAVLDRAPRELRDVAADVARLLSPAAPLEQLHASAVEARARLLGIGDADDAARYWLGELEAAISVGLTRQEELAAQLRKLGDRSMAFAYEMDFAPLYDTERRLFHIGYNVSTDRIDQHYYDLLATEARIASYFAIAKGDVPAEHWFFLGRPLTRERRGIALLSWNGSMFEYLMAPIFLRSGRETLVGESEHIAVHIQRGYARGLNVPWGISESAFALRDPEHRYRYQAFGSPGLGLKRDLGRDLVITPYASALALGTQPNEAAGNLRALWKMGANGIYGLIEAVDFTAGRIEPGRRFTPVRAYMAHHQGMILGAIGNALNDNIFVRRFHEDPRMATVDLLLSERVPREVPSEIDRIHERQSPPQSVSPFRPPHPWTPLPNAAFPQLLTLGNGRLSSWISEGGGGGLQWRHRALTRFGADATCDRQGLWIYVSDEEDGAWWSATRQPGGEVAQEYRVTFHPHMAEFHRRDRGIALRTEVAVAEGEDVEIRRVTIINETARPRSLLVTSYGEVVLAPPLDDERHPAFSKMFVKSEYLPVLQGLLFTRRPRQKHETPPALVHRLIGAESGVTFVSYDTDRRAFIGRGRDVRSPKAIAAGLSERTGWTLDPIMALQARVELAPHESRDLCFVTVAAGSRQSALEIAERHASMASVAWALDDAAGGIQREVQKLEVPPSRFVELQSLVSLLVYSHPALRGEEEVLRANRLGQPHLWGLGLSGDRPILLLKLQGGDDSGLLRELVGGHRLWSKRGLEVDLVVLKTGSTSYLEPGRDQILALLGETGVREYLGRKGGIHLLSADQIGPENGALLESVAHLVLDEERGNVAQQLASARTMRREIPLLQPSATPEEPTAPPLERPADLLFDNGLGGYSPDGSEYVIHLEPGDHTPAPWSNVLANDRFGCLVTEQGGGFTWAVNSGENRLTPWTNDPVADLPGEMLYLRDEETGEVWTPAPFAAGDTSCQVHHGIGYSRWRQRSRNLDQEQTVFVPPGASVKIIRLRVRNLAKRGRRVTATYFAEWQLGALRSVSTPAIVAEYDSGCQAIMARNPWNPDFAGVAFLGASGEPHSLTLDRHEFIGAEGDLRNPGALRRWGLSGNVASRVDPCAAYQLHLDLGPEQEQELVFVLGQGADRAEAEALVRRWRDPAQAQAGFAELQEHWQRQLGAVEVKTPDQGFDAIVNRWLLYQTISSRVNARAGFYQAGGAIGFRDQLQDMLAVLHVDPARVRAHILACAGHQFEAGDVMHWWHPPTDRGVRTRCSDDLLWLPYVTASYVRATGDLDILSVDAPFLGAAPLAAEEEDRYARFDPAPVGGSLFDHCVRAIEHGVTSGVHGLPLIGSGDWNDGMDRVGRAGRGESVWLAWFSIVTLESFSEVAQRIGREDLAREWIRRTAEIRRAAEENGWDGEWYRRAYDDDGEPWGSASNQECRIDSISQSWAALAGADPVRVRTALASASRELIVEQKRLVRLLTPPFDATPRDPGYIRSYPPGVRENGGQYSHAATWLGFAFARIGDGDQAYRIFDLLNPIRLTADRDACARYRTEPYVLAADIADGGELAGRGGWTWYTGSSAWLWRLGIEAILGISQADGGIKVAPCLPAQWKECEVRLRRPAGSLLVMIRNEFGVGNGRVELSVNGEAWASERVPFPEDGSTSQVIARILPRESEDGDLREAAL